MSPNEPSARRSFRVHLWIGAWLSAPLAFVVLTGGLATLSPELDALLVPELRCPGARRGVLDVSFGALMQGASEALPEARVHGLSAPAEDEQCAFALLEAPERTFHHVYFDPDTGEVRGRGTARTPRRVLRDLHRSLLLGENVGLTIVGLFSLVLAAALATGLSAIGTWRRALSKGRGSRRAHRVLGLALLPFVSLVVLTSGWYLGEHLFGLFDVRVTEVPPQRDPDVARRLRAGEAGLEVDSLVAAARDAYPELAPQYVALAVPRRTYVVVTGDAGVPGVRDLASQVFLDPFDGHVLRVQRADRLSLLGRWEHGVDFLHFGTFAGAPSRALYFALSLAVLSLIALGALGRWWRRR